MIIPLKRAFVGLIIDTPSPTADAWRERLTSLVDSNQLTNLQADYAPEVYSIESELGALAYPPSLNDDLTYILDELDISVEPDEEGKILLSSPIGSLLLDTYSVYTPAEAILHIHETELYSKEDVLNVFYEDTWEDLIAILNQIEKDS